jgi:hypothetical protein
MAGIRKEPHPSVYHFLQFNAWRKAGVPDAQIAERYGFKHPETLYLKLRRDGFPVCDRCGDYSPGGNHCSKRRAGSGGDKRKTMPATRDAQRLFWPLVESVRRSVDSLYWRAEYRQAGRFVAQEHVEAPVIFDHGTVDAQTWEKVRRAQKLDEQEHEADEAGRPLIEKGAFTQAGGGSWYPPEPLTTLIALYVLSEEPLDPLVEALHDDPANAKWEALERHVQGKDGLIRQARQVAALVRGSGRTSQGRHSERVDDEDHAAAMFIQQKRQEKLQDTEILNVLRDRPFLRGLKKERQVTMEDLKRLGNLRLGFPEN